MKLSDFNYNLPKSLIAQKPMKPRDHSRLLLLDLKRGAIPLSGTTHTNGNKEVKIEHKHFYDLPGYLNKGDVLILNNSKVFPARLIGKRKETGGKIEVFLLRKVRSQIWQCLVGSSRKKEGLEIEFSRELKGRLIKDNKDSTWAVQFNKPYKEMMKIVEKIGQVPLPPYIKRPERCRTPYSASVATTAKGARVSDTLSYQTVYADETKVGSVAAPTAGFHFTPRLIKKLKDKGVQFEYITLHVGLGTFAPVKVNNITKHKMHAEYVEVEKRVINNIIKAKKAKRRVIAVGTTSVRALEAIASEFPISNFQFPNKSQISMTKFSKQFKDYKKWVDLFIYPGYKFKIVDALITNFHLPKSTLLMLVSALAGKSNIDKAYKFAIKYKYRFYSYGDAMLII